MTTVLIDGDIVGFRAAISAEDSTGAIACHRADDTIRRILIETEADQYNIYLTGSTNFRKDIYPAYKANRVAPKPIHLSTVREFLTSVWGAKVTDGCEADDYLGIYQTPDTILASIDKDLKQIPGKHYNFVRNEFFEVSPLEGIRFFYKQTLIGDTSDNIVGVRGLGPKKTDKLLNPIDQEEEMYTLCRSLYKDDDRFHMNCKVLWILREFDQIWQPPSKCLAYYDQQKQQQEAESVICDPVKMESSESIGLETSGYSVSGIKQENMV
jgi:5'-3' exonuclease